MFLHKTVLSTREYTENNIRKISPINEENKMGKPVKSVTSIQAAANNQPHAGEQTEAEMLEKAGKNLGSKLDASSAQNEQMKRQTIMLAAAGHSVIQGKALLKQTATAVDKQISQLYKQNYALRMGTNQEAQAKKGMSPRR